MRPRIGKRSGRKEGGYTLIEVMVSTFVLGLSVVAMVTMLRKGKSAEDYRELERQASILLRGHMEDTAYHFRNYAGAASKALDDTLYLDTLKFPATGLITVGPEEQELWNPATNNRVKFKRIKGVLRWSLDGLPDSVVLSKRVAPVFP